MKDSASNVLGCVTKDWSLLMPKFSVRDKDGNRILVIETPPLSLKMCCNEIEFQVLSKDKTSQVGRIDKKSSLPETDSVSNSNKIGITFPLDLDVNLKATLLGAAFLIVKFHYLKKSQSYSINFNRTFYITTKVTSMMFILCILEIKYLFQVWNFLF